MKTSTKTNKARIVIGELPSANASNPLLVHSAAVVASVRGGLASGGINPWGQPLIFNDLNLKFESFGGMSGCVSEEAVYIHLSFTN